MRGIKGWGRAVAVSVAVGATTLALGGVAFADNVVNDVNVAAGDNTIAVGGSTTIGYKVNANGPDGCNASDGSAATVTLSVPAGVTASSTSLTFSACNSFRQVTFGSSTPGDYTIAVTSVQDSGGGSYTNHANWVLHVTGPSNTKPSVAVAGVSDGASYEIGAVPAATCDITDAEDGNSSAPAVVSGELSHGLGTQTATCDYTDQGDLAADTATATYTIVDTGAPSITHTLSPATPNGQGWFNEDVTVDFECADEGGSGIQSCIGDTTLGEGENQTVTGAATDWAGNTASDTVADIDIDTTDPTVGFIGGPSGSYYYGNDPATPTCDGYDALSGIDTCVITGGGSSVGDHTYTATATDKAGNSATATLSYTVLPWTMKGFYAPVDMGGVWNTVKGGSTVPLKFELFAGATELTDTSKVSLRIVKASCTSGAATTDAIEVLSSGATTLRYDATGGQFIQNWKTPTGAGCYSATMTAADGSSITALFKMLK